MNRAMAHLVRTMSSTDSGFAAVVFAYAIRHGTVSLQALSADIAEHFPSDDPSQRYFNRIAHLRGLRKTGRRQGGTLEYEIDPDWAERNPSSYQYYQVIAQEAF